MFKSILFTVMAATCATAGMAHAEDPAIDFSQVKPLDQASAAAFGAAIDKLASGYLHVTGPVTVKAAGHKEQVLSVPVA